MDRLQLPILALHIWYVRTSQFFSQMAQRLNRPVVFRSGLSCGKVSMTKWLVKGNIIGSIDPSNLDEIASFNVMGIERGLLWPIIGWEVMRTPGLQPMPIVMYKGQVAQPPC